MKKIIICTFFSFLFISCFSQKKNDIKIPELIEQEEKPVIYEHNQILNFENSGYNTIIYEKPFSSEKIYVIQIGDKIKLSEMWIYKDKASYVKAETPDGRIGFIKIDKMNPYANGNFSYLKTLNVDGNDIKILSITKSGFYLLEGTCMRELPAESSEVLHEVSYEESSGENLCDALEITDDYVWIKVKMQEFIGWVKCKDLIQDKGGPIIRTPQVSVFFFLIGQNEI